ncbi:TetR/AcrR family transcriptional regulator [Roseicyclus persicicus]|uniref:TetR/AcrR family transcriptional regulator n=1 Tax=Roseicyclus persicicus TaxID=2650661 RepID=A0A7X6JY69_9RHOB|nr:TetR/AcrR family transcriptional regulator [Roseibacterium persicicum]NKX43513.1 TetR/AcrR family transcriptional regulator [Roseibacterium persicicum]
MTDRRPGRPARAAATGRAAILDAGLRRVEAGEAISFRALGAELGVTAMAVRHHVGDSAALLRAMTGRVFAGIAPSPDGDPRGRLRATLLSYVARAARHPRLMQLTLADPALVGPDLSRLGEALAQDCAALTGDPAAGGHLRDILVDQAHGTILALCHAGQDAAALQARYAATLDWLLDTAAPAPRGGP